MSGDVLRAALAGLWAQNVHHALARVEALEAYARLLRTGDDAETRRAAEWDAHKLAGALGSYGRAGSDVAAQLEQQLRDEPDPDRVDALVASLRRAVEEP